MRETSVKPYPAIVTDSMLIRALEAVLKKGSSGEVLKYPRLQFWSDRHQEATTQSSSEGSRHSYQNSISPKEASLESIDKVKMKLDCTRLFIFTKAPRAVTYVLIGGHVRLFRSAGTNVL